MNKMPNEVRPGDALVGTYGGTVMVENCVASSAMPGFHMIETEFGCLYVDSDQPVQVTGESVPPCNTPGPDCSTHNGACD
jgi:hypothetical protein